jgi:hypothetical protein
MGSSFEAFMIMLRDNKYTIRGIGGKIFKEYA